MKNVLLIFFLFFCYNVVAQQRFPTGPPTQFSTGWFKQGYHQSDSGTIIANRDTNWLAKYSGTVVFKPSNKLFYWFDSTTLRWNQFGSTVDTTSLSNRINLKLNIADTANKWWGIGKRWVDTLYRVNDSTIGFTINNGAQQTFQILGRLPSGGGGSGTVTSVALSMPSAFTVTGSPITTSGTFSVSGAGTSAQYIRGNGTLATTDTGMIPNFHLKVRGLISGTSPITFNQTTGLIGINNANTSGTKGAATFNSSSFSDNGAGLISLNQPVPPGSCINCDITWGADGRPTSYASGTPPQFVNAPGAGDTLSILDTLKRLNAGFGINHIVTNYTITHEVDTVRSTGVPSYYYVDSLFSEGGGSQPGTPDNAMQYRKSDGTFGGDSLQYYPNQNTLLTSQDFIQYGRPVTGFFQDSGANFSNGYLWKAYSRGSGGSGSDTLEPFFGEIGTSRYDPLKAENPVFTILQFGRPGTSKPMVSIRLEQNYNNNFEYHGLTSIPSSMPNPNDEIRHESWTVSRATGDGVLHTRIGSQTWANSNATSSTYDITYASIGYDGFHATTYASAIGSISVTNGLGELTKKGIGMQIDTSSQGFAQLYTTSNVGFLDLGGPSTALTIANPATTGGSITMYKTTSIEGKELYINNVPNSGLGLGILGSTGYIFSVSTDGDGYANAGATGKFFINKGTGFSATERALYMYDGTNPADSNFHVRHNGNIWTKGLLNVKTLKTTLTAPATEGTTKVLICDTNGLVSNTTLMTLYSGDGTVSGNRAVNVNNLNLTFNDVNTFRVNYDAFVQSKANGTFPYTNAIVAPAQQLWMGYTPTAATFSKGSAVIIDTNNNVSLGTGVITSTHPLYTFGSAFAQGLTSARGNFYRVDSIIANATATLEQYFFIIDATSGNITLTLPAASTAFGNGVGVVYKLYRIDDSINTVTIAAAGSDTINGAASQPLTLQYELRSIQCISATGGKWAYE
jgi:hypothetical protein